MRSFPWRSLLLALVILPASGLVSAAPLVPNGGFEDGASGWQLVNDKAERGGEIIAEANGNHALSSSGDLYWLASTNYRMFPPIPREQFGGQRLRLTFRARGDQDAYPGAIIVVHTDKGTEYLTWYWRTQYLEFRRPLTEQCEPYEIVRELPANVAKIVGLSLYNCTRRGTVVLDDFALSIVPPATAATTAATIAAPQTSPWDDVQLSERELLELSNTANFLVAEWGRLYGRLLDAERAAHYRAGDATQAAALRQQTMALREKLLALQAFYTKRFQEAFGKTYTVDAPHNFYWHDDKHGRDLLMALGRTRSSKPEFRQLETNFTATGQALGRLLTKLGATPAPATSSPAPQPLFGDRFFPNRALIGLRATQYSWHAFRWLDADFVQVSNLAEWTFDEQEKMALAPGPFDDEVKAYDLRWELMAWLDPRVMVPKQRASLRAALDRDPTLHEATELGSAAPSDKGQMFQAVDFLHPMMRDYARKYWQELGALFRDAPRVVCFEYMAEPAPMARIDGRVYTFGYTDASRRAFRDGLQQRFKTIAALNAAWGSAYADFTAIEPPKYEALEAMAPADLPLIYEWRKFRKRTYADFEAEVAAAYRAGDQGHHPIANRFARMYLNGQWPPDPFHTYRLVDECTDIFCTHNCAEGSALDRAELVYYHSLAERLGKPRGAMEYYPLAPESNHFGSGSDYGLRLVRRGMNNMWLAAAWDVTMTCAWIQNSRAYEAGKNTGVWSPTRESGYTLLHDSAAAVSLVKSQMNAGLSDALVHSRVVPAPIAMLAPYDAPLVCWPPGQVAAEGQLVHRFLEEQNYDYTCVPEELIVSGEEKLTSTKVLVAPYVLWASRALQDKLLAWVQRGGMLIAVGPFGLWDGYGRPAGTLLRQAWGDVELAPKRAGLYTFRFPADELARRPGVSIATTVPTADGPQPNLIRADLGRGQVYITCDTTLDALLADSKRVLRRAMDEAIGLRTAWSLNGSLYLVTRQARQGNDRILVAINRSLQQPCEDTVVMRGEYTKITDAALGDLPVPARHGAGVTA
ncbi:MAG: beta-galactosidase, partial [Armatimonadetes bacterium]|nr:beta-galactosidase [Armatimonadota bacterium]